MTVRTTLLYIELSKTAMDASTCCLAVNFLSLSATCFSQTSCNSIRVETQICNETSTREAHQVDGGTSFRLVIWMHPANRSA